MRLKAISLWQPWASLWAAGIKIHETRSWPTTHKGLLAVHAALKRDADGECLYKSLVDHDYERLVGFLRLGPDFNLLAFGAIVGVVDLVECCRIPHIETTYMNPSTRLDYDLGDWTAGRYAWRTDENESKLFDKPIPCKGRQGFFNVEIPDDSL